MQANLIRYDYDKLTLIGLLAQRFRVDYHRTGYSAVVWRQGVKSFKEGVNEAKDEINKAKEEVDKPADK